MREILCLPFSKIIGVAVFGKVVVTGVKESAKIDRFFNINKMIPMMMTIKRKNPITIPTMIGIEEEEIEEEFIGPVSVVGLTTSLLIPVAI